MDKEEYWQAMKGWHNQLMKDDDYIDMMKRNKGYKPSLFENVDPKKFHKMVSYTKSIIRLIACGFGIFLYFDIAFAILALAEILGIVEEWKE